MPQGAATITQPDPAHCTDKSDADSPNPSDPADERQQRSAGLMALLETLKPIEEDFAPIADPPP